LHLDGYFNGEETSMPHTRNRVTLRFFAAPTDAGFTGTVDGGRVMEWIDKAAYACAVGWSGRYCVTAYVGNVRFTSPVRVGDLVDAEAVIVNTGRSSMHILVTVTSRDPRGGDITQSTQCIVIFVAVDDDGKPTPVPEWQPETLWELEQQDAAIRRITLRTEIETAMAEQSYTDAGDAPRSVFRFLAAPTDVNWGGKVHGGTVMRWMDETAFACASGWVGGPTIAVYAGGVRFYRPLLIGDLVEVEARLIHTRETSMHISVHVRSGSPRTGELELTTHSLIVFVALGSSGEAIKARPWVPVSDEDRALDVHARDLIGLRASTHLADERRLQL
jgi:4-hydroxybenzoyl-CoA thioesterase